MRGKGDLHRIPPIKDRITPAYAGKRHQTGYRSNARKDHPRVCGEKLEYAYRMTLREGSPPRMRGKGSKKLEANGSVGITPAYAGKSSHGFVVVLHCEDHPRVCGEKLP